MLTIPPRWWISTRTDLAALGALCERTWHDRLEIVAEGEAAKLWNPERRAARDRTRVSPRPMRPPRAMPLREVFPGCPLTFRLAETLRPSPLPLERVVLAGEAQTRMRPSRRWRRSSGARSFPIRPRWRLTAPFKGDLHFSLVALARCEIQAIDQHWSLHRAGGFSARTASRMIRWPGNSVLRRQTRTLGAAAAWPAPEPARWQDFPAALPWKRTWRRNWRPSARDRRTICAVNWIALTITLPTTNTS